jgi:hypothetical protein
MSSIVQVLHNGEDAQWRTRSGRRAKLALRKSSASRFIIALLAVLCLYVPTSIHNQIIDPIKFVIIFLTWIGFGAIIILNGIASIWSFGIAILVPMILFVATLYSSLPELALGAVLFFISISLVYVLNLRRIKGSKLLDLTFWGLNIANLLLGIGLVLNIPLIDQFFLTWYNDFYPDLLNNMVVWYDKPVLTFGSHSIAGLFLFLFMYVNHQAFLNTQKRNYLICALIYVALLWFLQSVTSLLLCAAAIIYILYTFRPRTHVSLWRWIMVILVLVISTSLMFQKLTTSLNEINTLAYEIFTSPQGGFLGRFSANGNLINNFHFFNESWYRPAGFRTSEDLFFGDSGPVEYMLRGSFALLFAVYMGLYLFLRNNLRSRRQALFLFATILITEVGFTHLKYFRLVGFLPFVVVYLNSLLDDAVSDTVER